MKPLVLVWACLLGIAAAHAPVSAAQLPPVRQPQPASNPPDAEVRLRHAHAPIRRLQHPHREVRQRAPSPQSAGQKEPPMGFMTGNFS